MCKLYFVVTYYILLIHIMHHYGRVAHHHATNGHQSTTTSSSRSEVNTELSQVLFEVTENVRITVFKKTCWAMPMDPSLRPPVRSAAAAQASRQHKNLKLQGNEYFQWKQRVLGSNLVRISIYMCDSQLTASCSTVFNVFCRSNVC